jgi:hypothetical protein
MNLKKRMVKTLVWSYSNPIWIGDMDNAEGDIKRLEAFERSNWRRMERISWAEHKTNGEILDMVGEKRSMIGTIRSRQRKWIGHIVRGDTMLRKIIEGRMEGRKTCERPRRMILDWMMTEDG